VSLASAARAVPDRVQRVALTAQPTLPARCATDLEHALSACVEVSGKTGAVAAGALDRPGAAADRVPPGHAKQLAVAAGVRGRRPPGDNSARRRHNDRHHVFVAVGIDAKHVVQLVCKHQTRSSDLCS